ncbi:MAG: Ig-like domain-containing protein [Bacteroidales bacterium]|jgi:uncharacterized protein YjdB|nr:Ig-like domain-containing protein [Bacteroidales bacterium]
MNRFKKVVSACVAVCMFGLFSCDKEENNTIAVESVEVTPTTIPPLEIGGTQAITVKVKPDGAGQGFEWQSSNNLIATYLTGTGEIKAGNTAGTATITFTSTADKTKSATVAVTVNAAVIEVTSVTVDQVEVSVVVGETQTVVATALPQGSSQVFSWVSSNSEVATVDDDGVISGVSPGTATITVSSAAFPSKTATVAVTVTPEGVAVEEIQTLEAIALFAGSSQTLTPTVLPAGATDKTITVESSASATVSVAQNDGVITLTANATGTATITVTSAANNNVTATIAVTVVNTLSDWATATGAAGLWEFDDPNDLTKATIGGDLTPHSSGYTAVTGGVVRVSSGTWFSAPHSIPTDKINDNDPSVVNNYTFMFDFRIPALNGDWYAFYNTDLNNSGGNWAECYLDGSINEGQGGKVGKGDYSAPFAQVDTWYRLVVVATAGNVKHYINGNKVLDTSNEHLSQLALQLNAVLLFADGDSYDAEFDIAATALWGRAFTDEEVAALGAY